MPKKKAESPKQKEESKPSYDFTTLSFAPTKYMTALAHIYLRVERSQQKATSQSEKNFQAKTLDLVKQLAEKLNADYEPKPPKTIESAYEYALSRKYEGTFLALLDEEGNLVKTVIVAKKRLSELPEFSIIERELQMTMNARYISVPELKIERAIPKRVSKVVPFSSDTKQVYQYRGK